MKKYLIIGIIILGGVSAGALIYPHDSPEDTQPASVEESVQKDSAQKSSGKVSIWDVIQPINQNDHTLGNPDAELTMIVYSDLECPYCSRLHKTMEQIMEEYGKNGKLLWVFRHFPVHPPTSPKKAQASECVAELAGDTAFWDYLEKMYENKDMFKSAEEMGISSEQLQKCLDSEKYKQKIEKTYQEAVNLGARGTPFGALITSNGEAASIPGALPYANIKEIIEAMLNL